MKRITVNFARENGKPVYPLHGVNSGPMTKVFTYDARPQFLEAGFPFARLHDVEYPYGSGEFVDIPCIFKNFDADENDPASYNFGLTDEYIRRIVEVGCAPLFRLGISIEHAPVKRYVYPPRDCAKWARICEHIIRHYNEGWANGFHWGIAYWEIWNESDGGNSKMWGGTPDEFYELYVVSARHLKACFPHLKIGGCGFTTAKNAFIEGFFAYISSRKEPVPLDFYSWHRYFDSIDTLLRSAADADRLLNTYGYGDAESILDEWNYMRDWNDQADSYRAMKNHIGAAHCGAVLCALQQQSNVRLATYFEADVVKEFCGLFDVREMSISRKCATLRPLKAFYAFKAFNRLYRLGRAVDAVCSGSGLYACAATGEGGCALLAANYCSEDTEAAIELCGWHTGNAEVRLIDEDHAFDRLLTLKGGECMTLSVPLKNHSVVYIGPEIT